MRLSTVHLRKRSGHTHIWHLQGYIHTKLLPIFRLDADFVRPAPDKSNVARRLERDFPVGLFRG